jgi:cobalt transport protein ATP-binding subunit
MADAILVEGLRFAYPPTVPGVAAPWVLDGIDLHVGAGEWLAVMGASDAGKTTLCLLLAGLAPHLTGGSMEGRVVVAGHDTQEHPPPALADKVGLVFQEPEAQLFNPTVEAEIAWGLENLGLPVSEIRARLDAVLAQFHIEDLRQRNPGDLSGGEKKRLALASVLAMRPAVLILDEPMGGLDPIGREQVLATLAALRRESSATIVMIESDPEAVAAFADRLIVLERPQPATVEAAAARGGHIALAGSLRDIFRREFLLAALGVAVPQLARVAATLNRRLGTTFDFLTLEEARRDLSPPLGEGQGEGEIGTQRIFPPPAQPSPAEGEGVFAPPVGEGEIDALVVNDLWYWYDEGMPVLPGINLRVPQGQFVALVGANGSGKTTLVKHFNGLLRPRRGQVRLAGQNTAHRSLGELARQVGFLFQHPEQQIFSATVRREVAFGPRNLGLSPGEVDERVQAALDRFRLDAVAERPPAILGYGVRRRVTLASLAAMDPPVLVLDEPTVGLDAPGLRETFDWLAELHAQGRTIVLVTHDMALVAEYAERAIVLHRGRILADGPPAKVFEQAEALSQASLATPALVSLAQALRPHGFRGDGLTVHDFCNDYITQANPKGQVAP